MASAPCGLLMHSTHIGDRDGCNDGTQQVDKDDSSHRETAETAQSLDTGQFDQVVNGRVDPSSSYIVRLAWLGDSFKGHTLR